MPFLTLNLAEIVKVQFNIVMGQFYVLPVLEESTRTVREELVDLYRYF